MVRLIRIFSNSPLVFLSFHGGPNSDNVVVKIPNSKAFRYLPTFTIISSTSTTGGAQSYVEVHHSCSHPVRCSSWTQVGTLGLPVGNCYDDGVWFCILDYFSGKYITSIKRLTRWSLRLVVIDCASGLPVFVFPPQGRMGEDNMWAVVHSSREYK